MRVPAARRAYAYPPELFERHDTFEMFLLDGGAFFFTKEHVDSTSSGAWLAKLADGSLLAPWMVKGKLQWDKAFDDTYGSPCWAALEKHVWLNRLYFLLPMAHRFLLTRDERWAELWLRYLRSWSAAHPYARDERYPATKRNWRDMQVTWRLLVLTHSTFLLGGSKYLDKPKWAFVYRMIRQHAEHVHWEAAKSLAEGTGKGNHFLQKGLALLYAGILLPELGHACEYIKTGRGVVKQQLNTEIDPDGGSIEASPSYSHFIARMYLEAHLLLKQNKLPPIPGLESKLRKQYAFLELTAAPDGTTLQLSDSYAMDADADIALVREVYPLPKKSRNASVAFPRSGFAVLRSRRFAAYIDAMLGAGHVHPGKPNVLIYVDGKPLTIDSGSANYDTHWQAYWYRLPEAHNILLIRPTKDEGRPAFAKATAGKQTKDGTAIVPTYRLKRFDKRSAVFEHVFKEKGFRFVWTRALRIDGESLTIDDRVKASRRGEARQLWHIAPWNLKMRYKDDPRRVVVRVDKTHVLVRQMGAKAPPFAFEYRPAIGPDNRVCNSAQISSCAVGREFALRTRLTIL